MTASVGHAAMAVGLVLACASGPRRALALRQVPALRRQAEGSAPGNRSASAAGPKARRPPLPERQQHARRLSLKSTKPRRKDPDQCESPRLAKHFGYGQLWKSPICVTRKPVTPPLLSGKEWCADEPVSDSAVALILTGQAFRARNFFNLSEQSCSNGTLESQRLLAENHHNNIIKPIKDLGFRVDIYLTHVPCAFEPRKNVELEANSTIGDTLALLKELYSREGALVQDTLKGDSKTLMYSRIGDSFRLVERHASRNGTYAYFIFNRYDVYLDRAFTSMIADPLSPHRGLSFFTHAHDFMFAFPGEMWSCMRNFWHSCMEFTQQAGIGGPHGISCAAREEAGCFKFGALPLEAWAQGFAYDISLDKITKAVNRVQPKHLSKTGCSGFDGAGREHRCISSWYWPPRNSWEHAFMPAYFHIG